MTFQETVAAHATVPRQSIPTDFLGYIVEKSLKNLESRRYTCLADTMQSGNCAQFYPATTMSPELTKCLNDLFSKMKRTQNFTLTKDVIRLTDPSGYCNYLRMHMWRCCQQNPKYVPLLQYLHAEGFDWAECIVSLALVRVLWEDYCTNRLLDSEYVFCKGLVNAHKILIRQYPRQCYTLAHKLSVQATNDIEREARELRPGSIQWYTTYQKIKTERRFYSQEAPNDEIAWKWLQTPATLLEKVRAL